MKVANSLLTIFGIDRDKPSEIKKLSLSINIDQANLIYYNDNHLLPTGRDLNKILEKLKISKIELMLKLGIYDSNLFSLLAKHSDEIVSILVNESKVDQTKEINQVFSTQLGKLYQGDCISVMKQMEDECFDLVFADPPFNLKKLYPSGINDDLSDIEYLHWTEKWIEECIRLLKPGGSLFFWNIPKWNIPIANYLSGRLTFRSWIAVDIKYSLPIPKRLYPSHYSLLFYCKGEKPKTFHPDRMQMEVCPKCYTDLKDYGGYKDKMNPLGVNLTDIWVDIPPVRHSKHKKRKSSNELSIKLLDRIIEMSTNEGDTVFDPFGGSGSTYVVAELKNRKWKGIEIGPPDEIIDRFNSIENDLLLLEKYRSNYNSLFPDHIKRERIKRKLWTDADFNYEKNEVENSKKIVQQMRLL